MSRATRWAPLALAGLIAVSSTLAPAGASGQASPYPGWTVTSSARDALTEMDEMHLR